MTGTAYSCSFVLLSSSDVNPPINTSRNYMKAKMFQMPFLDPKTPFTGHSGSFLSKKNALLKCRVIRG